MTDLVPATTRSRTGHAGTEYVVSCACMVCVVPVEVVYMAWVCLFYAGERQENLIAASFFL